MASSKTATRRRRHRRLKEIARRDRRENPSQPVDPCVSDTHPLGVEFRINNGDYGPRYSRVKGTVTGYDDGKVSLQTSRRKAPVMVDPAHLDSV